MMHKPQVHGHRVHSQRSARTHALRESGLSIIEVLIAALLFLVIMLGTLPLFTQAMTSNTAGSIATDNASDIKDAIERVYQTRWAQVNRSTTTEIKTLEGDEWVDLPLPGGETLRSTRTTTIREYHLSALEDDGELTADEALPAGSDPFWTNLKEIEVNILGEAEGVFASTQDVTQSVLRSQ